MLVLALALLTAASAPDDGEAMAILSRAWQQMEDQDYDQAASALREVAYSEAVSSDLRQRALHWLGRVEVTRGQMADAELAFRELLWLNPRFKLPKDEPKKVKSFFATVKKRWQREGKKRPELPAASAPDEGAAEADEPADGEEAAEPATAPAAAKAAAAKPAAAKPAAETDDAEAAAAEDAEPARPKLLVMQFVASGMEKAKVTSIEDIAGDAFARLDRFDVVTGADLAELLSLEADKQAVGCTDADCVAEIAGALGADYVVTGRLSQLGKLYVLKVSLLYPSQAKTIGTETIEVDSLEALAYEMRAVGVRLTAAAFGEEVPKEFLKRDIRDEYEYVEEEVVEDEGPQESSVLSSVLLWGGLAGMGGGALLLAGGVAGVGGSGYTVWMWAESPGALKGVARIAGNVSLVVVPISVVLLAGAGVVTLAGMVVE